MNLVLEEFNRQLPIIVPKLISGLVVLVGFWIAGIIVEKVTILVGKKAHIHKDIITLLGRMGRIALILLGLVSAMGTIGINVSALVASLGLTGFALGFALRDALSNVLAGALILIYHPFQCGEIINTSGYEGEVIEIDLRYTTIRTEDKKVLIPNSKLFSNPVALLDKKAG